MMEKLVDGIDYQFQPIIPWTEHWIFYFALLLFIILLEVIIYYNKSIKNHYKTLYALVLGFIFVIIMFTSIFQYISNQKIKELKIQKDSILSGNEKIFYSDIESISIENISNTSPILPSSKDTTRCIFIDIKEKPTLVLSSNNFKVDSIYKVFKQFIAQ